MDGPSRTRCGRLLLVLAAIFGVVAMHSLVGAVHDGSMPAPQTMSVAVTPAHADTAIAAPSPDGHAMATTDSSGVAPMSPTSPMPMPHAVMHLCLAILAAAVLLGLLGLVLALVIPVGRSLLPRARRPGVRPARPPLPTAVRLAQLCVLRN